MTKNPRQQKKVTPLANPVRRKRVAKHVGVKMGKANILPEFLEIPVKVMDTDLCIFLCPKYKAGSRAAAIAKQRLAQLYTERYEPMFATFSNHFNGQIIHVYLFARKPENLRSPKAGVQHGKRGKVRSGLVGVVPEFETRD